MHESNYVVKVVGGSLCGGAGWATALAQVPTCLPSWLGPVHGRLLILLVAVSNLPALRSRTKSDGRVWER